MDHRWLLVRFLQALFLHLEHRFCVVKRGKRLFVFDNIDYVIIFVIQTVEQVHDEGPFRNRRIDVGEEVSE